MCGCIISSGIICLFEMFFFFCFVWDFEGLFRVKCLAGCKRCTRVALCCKCGWPCSLWTSWNASGCVVWSNRSLLEQWWMRWCYTSGYRFCVARIWNYDEDSSCSSKIIHENWLMDDVWGSRKLKCCQGRSGVGGRFDRHQNKTHRAFKDKWNSTSTSEIVWRCAIDTKNGV